MIKLNAKKLHQELVRHDRIGRCCSVWANEVYFTEDGKMMSSDNEIQITTVLDGEFSVSATVDRKKLKDIAKSLGTQTITIKSFTDNLHIVTDSGTLTIENTNNEDTKAYNEIEYENNESFQLKYVKNTYLSLFKPLLTHAAKQDVRYYLNGVLVDVDDKGDASLVATDGHRLMLAKAGTGEKTASRNILARRLLDIATKSTTSFSGDVLLNVGNVESSIVIGETTFSMKNIDGRFPEYQRVIPNNTVEATFDREQLLNAVELIKPFAGSRYQGLKFTFKGQLNIEAGGNSKNIDYQDIKHKTDDMEIGLNAEYVIDALKTTDSELVNMQLNDGHSSVLVVHNEYMKNVVMPMRL